MANRKYLSQSLSLEDRADLEETRQATYADDSIGEVIVADGFVHLRIWSGVLEITDGLKERRKRRVTRTDPVARVVVLGCGTITTPVMDWCLERRLPLVITNTSQDEIAMIGAPTLYDHGALRRAQALAVFAPGIGPEIARFLLDRRLSDQARIAADVLEREDVALAIEDRRKLLLTAPTIGDMMTSEARAADTYWRAFESLEARFASKDRHRVPDHWRRFGQRRSPLGSRTNRQAITVPNSLLNYGYKLAEIEATIAAIAMGLDPAMGLLHSDGPARKSFAFDLMEPVRGLVESAVISFCRDHIFRKIDFHERPDGELRILRPISHELARVLMPALRDQLAPVVEHVATTLATLGPADMRVPTHLSETSRGRVARTPRVRRLERRCKACGRSLTEPGDRRVYCSECLPEDARRHRKTVYGQKPAQTHNWRKGAYARPEDARKADGEIARHAEQKTWELEHAGMARPDPALFEPIRTALSEVPVREIMAATGLALSSARMVRSGRLVPHARHWLALAKLAGVPDPRSLLSSDQQTDLQVTTASPIGDRS